MILEETYTLAGGVEISKPAHGTWFIDNENTAWSAFCMSKETCHGE